MVRMVYDDGIKNILTLPRQVAYSEFCDQGFTTTEALSLAKAGAHPDVVRAQMVVGCSPDLAFRIYS